VLNYQSTVNIDKTELGPSFHLHPTPPRQPARSTPPTAMPVTKPGEVPTRKSPGRSFSLSLKSKGKLPLRTGLNDRRWEDLITPNHDRRSPTTSTSTSDSLRRTMSSEDTQSMNTRSSTPPLPPPKDPIPQRPPDSESAIQLRDVRMRMSSQDQEAMRKLRLTMDMPYSEPGSPNRGNSSTSLGMTRLPLGSRRSTLSRQITSEDLDDPMPTVCRTLWCKSDDRMSRLNRNLNLILLLRLLDIVMLASRRLSSERQRLGGSQIRYIHGLARVIPVSPFFLPLSTRSQASSSSSVKPCWS